MPRWGPDGDHGANGIWAPDAPSGAHTYHMGTIWAARMVPMWERNFAHMHTRWAPYFLLPGIWCPYGMFQIFPIPYPQSFPRWAPGWTHVGHLGSPIRAPHGSWVQNFMGPIWDPYLNPDGAHMIPIWPFTFVWAYPGSPHNEPILFVTHTGEHIYFPLGFPQVVPI